MTRGEKAAETRRKNQQRMMREMGAEAPVKKKRRKRKPMTEEQRKAAAERLVKAREARGVKGDAAIHEDLRDIPEDSKLHWKKVKEWIKNCQSELQGMKAFKNSNKANERQEYISLETYIDNLKKYLSTGIYLDYRYGERREGRMQEVCLVMAYNRDGTPKRSVGVYYPDIGQIWTREMEAFNGGGESEFFDSEEL